MFGKIRTSTRNQKLLVLVGFFKREDGILCVLIIE